MQVCQGVSLTLLVSYIPLQENYPGLTAGKVDHGGHLIHLPSFTDEKVG